MNLISMAAVHFVVYLVCLSRDSVSLEKQPFVLSFIFVTVGNESKREVLRMLSWFASWFEEGAAN